MKEYSFLMSVYINEKAECLKQSIDSMINQTVSPSKIIIVEDGPLAKELYDVIDSYVQQYGDLFIIVKLEHNGGLGNALNHGIKHCTTELIARMDSDDICFPERCEMQLKEFEKNPDLKIVGTQILEFIGETDNVVPSRYVPEKYEDIQAFAKKRSPFNHPTVMYKKDAVVSSGGYGTYGRKEDLELFVKMVHDNNFSINLPQPLLYYRTNEDNLKRRKSWINCKEYIQIMYNFYAKNYIGFFDFLYVLIGQIILFAFPCKIVRIISNTLLRK